MNEIRLHIADDDLPPDAETREARHEVLASFLAAYADGELPPETQSQLDAHLAGCARCRRELNVHRTLRDRLEREPVPAATAALRERIVTGIRSVPAPVFLPKAAATPASSPVFSRWWIAAVAVACVLVAGVGARAWRGSRVAASADVMNATTHNLPIFDAVLSDYRRVSAGDLPGRARDLGAVRAAVPFAVAPLTNPGLRLIAAWTTSLSGEPAAVLAYRWNEHIVFQYLIPEALLFQSSNVRAMLTKTKAIATHDGAQNMMLWAAPESGAILVGEVSTSELSEMRAAADGR